MLLNSLRYTIGSGLFNERAWIFRNSEKQCRYRPKKIIYEDFVLKPSKAWSFILKNTCARINNYLNLDARVRGISALLFKLSTDATYYTK